MANVIHAENLSLSYDEGKKKIIQNAKFSVKRGEFVFITGRSGSGKSTLLKSFYGNLQPTDGSLMVGGLEMKAIPRRKLQELRTHIGIIFQDYKLINEWNVAKNVVLPLMIAGFSLDVQKTQAQRLLKHVKLSEHANRFPL